MKFISRALQIISVILALAAAIVGASVAFDGSAEHIFASVKDRGGMDLFGSDFNALLQSLISDGKRNAVASICAALAALLQGVALVLEWKNTR